MGKGVIRKQENKTRLYVSIKYNKNSQFCCVFYFQVIIKSTSCCGTIEQFRATEGTLNTLNFKKKSNIGE